MNLWLRLLIRVFVARFRRSRIGILDSVTVPLKVWPSDLDLSAHMNNGRYFTVMDLARIELLIRTGLFDICVARRWAPVLAAAKIRYRRELRLGQRYRLTCRVIWWDAQSIFMEQRFLLADESVAAIALLRGRFRGPDGTLNTATLFESLGMDAQDPPQLPDHLADWMAAEDSLRTVTSSS